MTNIFEVRNSRLHDVVAPDATIVRVAGGFSFTEGPVWYRDSLLFSDINNHRIARWRELPEGPEVTTFATGSSNGLTLDREQRIIAAEHDGRRVSRVAGDGTRTVLAERFQDKRLNSPNDVVVRSDGSIYFTDPPYALVGAPGGTRALDWWQSSIPGKELDVNGVYRISPDGELQLLVDDFALPNGLAFSPDESLLYVNDSPRRIIRAFTVAADGTLSDAGVLADLASPDEGSPDGMKVDTQGNVFCTGPGGIWVITPQGEILGRIFVPEQPANVAWGGDGHELFITARTSVYRLTTRTEGRLLS